MAEATILSCSSDKIAARKNAAATLKEALDIYIKKVLKEMKFVMLRHGYMEFFKDNPASLKEVHNKVLSQLKDHLESELCKMCKDENMEAVLGSLDEIISEYDANLEQTTWRPSGNPPDDVRDHLHSVKLQHKERLENMLAELDEKNTSLLNVVKTNEEELLQRNSVLTEMMSGYVKAVDAFSTNSVTVEERGFPSLGDSISEDDE